MSAQQQYYLAQQAAQWTQQVTAAQNNYLGQVSDTRLDLRTQEWTHIDFR